MSLGINLSQFQFELESVGLGSSLSSISWSSSVRGYFCREVVGNLSFYMSTVYHQLILQDNRLGAINFDYIRDYFLQMRVFDFRCNCCMTIVLVDSFLYFVIRKGILRN